jgi:hypothetical protein
MLHLSLSFLIIYTSIDWLYSCSWSAENKKAGYLRTLLSVLSYHIISYHITLLIACFIHLAIFVYSALEADTVFLHEQTLLPIIYPYVYLFESTPFHIVAASFFSSVIFLVGYPFGYTMPLRT